MALGAVTASLVCSPVIGKVENNNFFCLKNIENIKTNGP